MLQCVGLTIAVGAMIFNFLDKGKKNKGELGYLWSISYSVSCFRQRLALDDSRTLPEGWIQFQWKRAAFFFARGRRFDSISLFPNSVVLRF